MKENLKSCNQDNLKEFVASFPSMKKVTDMKIKNPVIPSSDEYITCYFDSETGDDESDGKDIRFPKKTLREAERIIKAHDYKKGLRILLKKGARFHEDFALAGYSAKEKLPLIVSSYGDGENKPVIVGEKCAISLCESNTVIDGLEVTGKKAYQGIYVTCVRKGAVKNVTIKNCYVHDVNFDWNYENAAKDTAPDLIDVEKVCPEFEEDKKTYGRYRFRNHGGIIMLNATTEKEGASWFENVYIINNVVENVARTGITIYSRWSDKAGVGYGFNKSVKGCRKNDPEKSTGYYEHKNVVCSFNKVVCAGGDAIVVSSVKNCVIENNVSEYANYLGRKNYWNAGIWVFNVNNCLFRFNEARNTYMRKGSEDAQGFDLDNCCRNVVFCNNYSHHNEGGGLLMCNNRTVVKKYDKNGNLVEEEKTNGKWGSNYVFNNVFAYNGNKRDNRRSAFVTIAREIKNVLLKNNLVVADYGIKNQSLAETEDKSQYCYGLVYENNVFYSEEETELKLTDDMAKDRVFSGNVFINVGDSIVFSSEDEKAITKGVSVTVPKNTNGFENYYGYKIDGVTVGEFSDKEKC